MKLALGVSGGIACYKAAEIVRRLQDRGVDVVVLMVTDRDPTRAAGLARQIAEFLDSQRSNAIRILGPAPAPLERIKRVHRHQLLIKSSSRSTLHGILDRLQVYIEEKKIGATRVIIDVDPVSLL